MKCGDKLLTAHECKLTLLAQWYNEAGNITSCDRSGQPLGKGEPDFMH